MSKPGNASLWKALDLPTPTAIRFNPLLKGFFERPIEAGSRMRKLVML